MWKVALIGFALVSGGAMFACGVPVGSSDPIRAHVTGGTRAQCDDCDTSTDTSTGSGTSTDTGGGGGGPQVTSACYPGSPHQTLCSALGNRVGVLNGLTCAELLGYTWSAEYAQNTWIPSLPNVSSGEVTAMQTAVQQSAQAYGAAAATQAAWDCGSLAATLSSLDPDGIVAGGLDCSNGKAQYDSHTYLASALPDETQAINDVNAFAPDDANPAALVCPEGGYAILNDPPPISGFW